MSIHQIQLLQRVLLSEEVNKAGHTDCGAGILFDYTDETVNQIIQLLEHGSNSTEIEQVLSWEEGLFDQYIEAADLIVGAADNSVHVEHIDYEGSEPHSSEAEPPILDPETQAAQPRTNDAPFDDESEANTGTPKAPKGNSKKRGMLISVIAGLILFGGGLLYAAYYLTKAPDPTLQSQRSITPIKPIAAQPAPAPANSAVALAATEPMPMVETINNTQIIDTAPAVVTSSSALPVTTLPNDSAQLYVGTYNSPNDALAAITAVDNLRTDVNASIAALALKIDAAGNQAQRMQPVDIQAVTADVEARITQTYQQGLASMRRDLASLSGDLIAQINLLKQQLAAVQAPQSVTPYVTGKERLGHFNIVSVVNDGNLVIALSPKNAVITLTKGEKVSVSGMKLEVKEIVANGGAIVFSDNWFIDNNRMPLGKREEAILNTAKAAWRNKVKRTSVVAAHPTAKKEPASLAVRAPARQDSLEFLPIQDAPRGWILNGVIPPSRAIITTPEGDTLTADLNDYLPGLGSIKKISANSIFVGNFIMKLKIN